MASCASHKRRCNRNALHSARPRRREVSITVIVRPDTRGAPAQTRHGAPRHSLITEGLPAGSRSNRIPISMIRAALRRECHRPVRGRNVLSDGSGTDIDGVVQAAGRVTEALETIGPARGHLYYFHQLTGRAGLRLDEAVARLNEIGEADLAQHISCELIGRNVLRAGAASRSSRSTTTATTAVSKRPNSWCEPGSPTVAVTSMRWA